MFPNVTSSKDDSIKDKLKERKWQDRFAVKSTIPDYSPLKDRHTASYRKLINNIVPKDKYESTPTKGKQQKTYFEKKVELFENLKSLHPVYMSHLEQFEDFLTSSKLPNFYLFYSVLPLCNEIDVNGYILKTRKSIKEQTSSYHRIAAAIKAREQCLSTLKSTVSTIKPDTTFTPQLQSTLKQSITHFRALTANTIDQIKRWRDSLNLKQERAIFYTSQNNENCLIKMLNDNQFLFTSALGEFINFGEKNDPFVIVPLKKAEGKQASKFLEILDTQKNLAYYQKYMEYLASEKAYEMSLIPVVFHKREPKYPEIEKVYKSKSTAKFESMTKKQTGDFDDLMEKQAMQREKLREQRIRKNQQRINAIKNVYQSYSSKGKGKDVKKEKQKKVQTDVEEKTKRQRNSGSVGKAERNTHKSTLLGSDEEFERMVKNRLEKQKNKKFILDETTKSTLPQTIANTSITTQRQAPTTGSKSVTKLPPTKTEDRMIENLKQIQQTLKSKLNFMNEQTRKQESTIKRHSTSSQRFHQKKNNETLISELKSQIIKNLELQSQQREAQRTRRRQEEEKAIEEIKTKMKREMEEKLEQKKREKLLEREELEKKLKEEENRLNKQRDLELQLQVKLAKQRQLRELEKVKRESLEKQMKFKQELEKEQKLRRQREQTIDKERKEKQKILQQLKKKELKEQLEKQIKEEMRAKYGENSKLYDKEEMSIVRQQKQKQLTKEIEQLKVRQSEEIEQMRKENELRERMIKLKKEEEQLKRKQIQHLMKSVIQQEKEDIHRETLMKRIQLEEEIKNNAKEKLLEEYKAEKQVSLEKTKLQRERQLEEDVYREKIKEKIEKELRIEAIQRTKKDMEERQTRKYEINTKLESSKIRFEEVMVKEIDREKIEDEVKKQLIEKVIFDKQAERESAKNDLRAQFERELMSSALPNIYESRENDPIVKKNIQKFKDNDYLRNKMTQLDSVKPTNQKPTLVTQSRQDIFNSILSESPKKLSRNESMIRSITNEQKEMYSKKRGKVDDMRSQPSYKLPKKLTEEEEEGFQLMSVQKDDKESEFEVKIVKKNAVKKEQEAEEKQYAKKRSKKAIEKDSEDESRMSKKNKRSTQSPSKKKYQSEQEDSQDLIRVSPNKKNISPKKRRQSDQAPSSQQQQQPQKGLLKKQMSRRTEVINIKRNDTYGKESQPRQSLRKTDIVRKEDSPLKLTRKSTKRIAEEEERKSSAKVYYDAQNPLKVTQMIPEEEKIQLRQVKHAAESKYEIKLEAIPQGDLDEYLAGHYAQLPEIQRLIQLQNRQQLYRKLINELTFCMLLGYQKSVIVGMSLAFHDRNKTDSRKFTIIHFSTYHNEDLKDFLTSCINYIFKKDPADEIEFHYKFDESIEEQAAFSTDFNKWFDKFGNVYQKKVDDNVFERKYAMKRQFNQKCEVVLGGVNKNTFRNLFSVYCGVVMSDGDMVQYKQELKDVVTPENEISYSVAIAELFRNYLSPDQAETLKVKVKEFVKLKELLILVVMLQKKKVKMEEIKLTEYKNLIELNMKLMSQGKDVIRYCKDSGMDMNRIYYAELSQAFNLPFNFQTTSLPIESQASGKVHQISYFRLSPLPPNKLHIIKSSLYNSELHILPTQSSKYKLFVINAQQYNEIKESNHLDIFMYVRLFLKNVKSHNTASWKYVWLPQMTDRANFSIREFKSFLNKDIYCHDSVNISYRQFLPNALIIEPEHRDLVITPPFIVGIMSMALEQVTEGSPLYARMIDVPALRTIEIEE